VYQPASPCLSDDTDTSSSTTASPNSLRGFDKKRNKFFRNSTNMEFLVPHPPSSIINKTNQQNGGFVLRQNSTGSTFVNQQHQQKMTKKQLKLAQAQLDKLTQINIHLHGRIDLFSIYIYFQKIIFIKTLFWHNLRFLFSRFDKFDSIK